MWPALALELMERYLCNIAHVDANSWQGPAASDAARQPLVECPVVRNRRGLTTSRIPMGKERSSSGLTS